MICGEAIQAYGLRSLGLGEKLLPRDPITFCDQVVLIGSGMIWNVYFGVLALAAGFGFATLLALAKASPRAWLRKPADWFVFVFRGSPLFIQFFLAYFLFLSLKQEAPVFQPLTTAAWGALVVLFLNTSAYSGQIFYGALMAVPRGDLEAADAYGLSGWRKFRRITWPTMLRLAWPAYTNEAIFLFHATVLVFFTGFPAIGQQGDALYYASYFASKTYNPFVPYPILAVYFVALTLVVIALFGAVNRRLNRHLPEDKRPRMRLRPQVIR